MLTLLLGGCMALVPPRIADLQWTSVEVHRPLVETPDLAGAVLVIHLRTRRNLADIRSRHGMGGYAHLWGCESGHPEQSYLGASLVLDPAGNVLAPHHPLELSADEAGWRHVWVELRTVGHLLPDVASRPGAGYDLLLRNEDICLDIAGGNMLGVRYRSNTIRIPAAAIRAALASGGP
ncbi:hypothetical protein [Siccirubricoccus phaeus]|uniref:hypothetical protein n=1 Tax=Siccirubricoccus phaeus TaxID=2595053 RepID=UPI0011F36EBE|nr:hypothetical protein [Siccirubricoccus phaeus]